MRETSVDGIVVHLDCINVNSLDTILYYSFIRCYHWGILNKGHMGSLCIVS